MAGKVEIKDQVRDRPGGAGTLAVSLGDLLQLLQPQEQALMWSLLDIEAVGDLGPGQSMLDLERRVREARSGLVMTWEELTGLASRLFQVINLTLAGFSDEAALRRSSVSADLTSTAEIVIEGIDSSLWSVYAKDDDLLGRIRQRFHEVTVL